MSDRTVSFANAPIEIIDGDRGVNYPQKSEFKSEGYCLFLNTSNVTSSGFNFSSMDFISKEKDEILRKGKLQRGDIVLTTRGTVGNVAYYDDEVPYQNLRINSGMIILRIDKSKLNPYYLYLFLRSNLFKNQVISQGSGSAQPQLPIGSLKFIHINWTELSTQNRIVSVLSAIDYKIALNNRINTELEAMAKTVYDYWFVQFDFPFDFASTSLSNNAQGKPSAEGKPYKSSGGKMVWCEELKREVPEGWEVDNLLKVSNLEGGGTPNKAIDEYWNGEISFYTPSDYTNSLFVMKTESSITKIGLKNCSSKLFPKGSIFITARGTVGNVSIASENMAMNQSCYAFCEKKEYSYCYLYYTVSSLINVLKAKSGGSVFNSIVSNDIKHTNLPIPPENVAKEYKEICDPIFSKILVNQQENQQLSSLRDWLLPMLMNGQVMPLAPKGEQEEEWNGMMAAEPRERYGEK